MKAALVVETDFARVFRKGVILTIRKRVSLLVFLISISALALFCLDRKVVLKMKPKPRFGAQQLGAQQLFDAIRDTDIRNVPLDDVVDAMRRVSSTQVDWQDVTHANILPTGIDRRDKGAKIMSCQSSEMGMRGEALYFVIRKVAEKEVVENVYLSTPIQLGGQETGTGPIPFGTRFAH